MTDQKELAAACERVGIKSTCTIITGYAPTRRSCRNSSCGSIQTWSASEHAQWEGIPRPPAELLAELEGGLLKQGFQQRIHVWAEGCIVVWAREFDPDFTGWWHPLDPETGEIVGGHDATEALNCPRGEGETEQEARIKAAVAAVGKVKEKPCRK